ncbi:MAG TPA: ABC transporter substrate-binding protein, partial [Xanthobacteraceae bacterium]|nr:ABC transporter substrate-binding protein [Xanthobacteraceae bacterium]
FAVRAQDAGEPRRVGVLSSLGESDPEARSMAASFHHALQEAGWIDGRNVRVEHRWAAGSVERSEAFAKELVGWRPDVIVAHTTPSVIALRKETTTIPIVFAQISDPIGAGFVANLAHPGGNITGFSNFEASIGSKWIELLKEMAPGVTRGAILFNPETAPYVGRYYQGPFEAAARSFGVQPSASPVRSDVEIASALAALQGKPPGGLIVMPDTFNIVHRQQIIELAAHHRVPAIYPYSFAAREGGLISYGIDPVDLFRRAAGYVDRILKGAKAAELPMQAPVKFELLINLKTANALALRIPPTLLATADDVIE